MREAGRIEVECKPAFASPCDPRFEMFRRKLGTVHETVRFCIDGMQVHALRAGYHRHGLVQVLPQFGGVAGASRIIAGREDASGRPARVVLESDHVVALPAVN